MDEYRNLMMGEDACEDDFDKSFEPEDNRWAEKKENSERTCENDLNELEKTTSGLKDLRNLALAEKGKSRSNEERVQVWAEIYDLFQTGNEKDRKKAISMTIQAMSPYMYNIVKKNATFFASRVNRSADVEDFISSMYIACIEQAEKYNPYYNGEGTFVLGSTYIMPALQGCRRDFKLGGDGTGTGVKRTVLDRVRKERAKNSTGDCIVSDICYGASLDEMMATPSGQIEINSNYYTDSPEDLYFREHAVGYDGLLRTLKKTEQKNVDPRTKDKQKKQAFALFKGLEDLRNITITFEGR